MVFEGVLVSVLNRFIGPYVKNLDSSQLKVAIWSGEVQLQALEVKENALTQFEIPLRVLKGHLDKLHLSIPWKNLYTDPVVIEIDGVYIIAGPESGVRYDPLKEAKEEKEKKQRKLKQIEDARKKAELDMKKSDQDPGFVEKLITQIVRNVQLTVRNIHIRYEDNVTNPNTPFAFGITLDSLLLQSTNDKWEIKYNITPEDTTSSIIHKLVKLDCLALYWNCGTHFISGLDEWKEKLKQGISDSNDTSPVMNYVLSPLSASAKLKMTTRPGEDINTPQLTADLVVYKVLMTLEKQQYQDILALVDSVDRMMIGRKYRKYRPSVNLSNNASIWWKYAYNAVLEEDVKRRLYMWSWKRMKEHRLLCKQYTNYYTQKLVSENVSAYIIAKIEDIEDELDIFNITVCRQLAENMAQKQLKLKQQQKEESSWFGWATGWITGGNENDAIENIPSEDDIEAERDKLYNAIGYSQKGKVADYPEEYVAHKIQFNLRCVSFKFLDAAFSIGHLITDNVLLSVRHRPAVQNINVKTSVQQLSLTGSVMEGPPPCIITSDVGSKVKEEALLSVEFDLNPLNSIYDQRLRLKLLPIKVTYDGATVDHIISMFLPPPSLKLQKISSGVSSTIESLKTQTRAGLEHAISQRKLMDMDIFLCSPVIYIPEGGVMNDDVRVVCVDLGSLQFISNMKHNIPDVREATLGELEELFYDHFKLCIEDVNLTIGVEHLIDPMQLDIEIHKSLLPNDTRLPGLKVSGKLPCISVNLSDKKVKDVIKLVQSLPFPPPALTNREQFTEKYAHIDTPEDLGTIDILNVSVSIDKDELEESDDEFITASEGEDCEVVQERKSITESTTKVAIDFTLQEMIINFSEDRNKIEDVMFDMKLSKFMVDIQVASWDTTVHASIDSLIIQDHYNTKVPFFLLGCNEAEQFVNVSIVQANRDAPHYKSTYHMTHTGITASVSAIKINLRQDTVCHILEISRDVISNIQTKDHEEVLLAVETQPSKQDKKYNTMPSEIDMNISVNLSGVHLTLSNSELGDFLNCGVHQVTSSIIKTYEKTNIHAGVKNVYVRIPLVDREDQRNRVLSEVVNSVGSQAVDVKIVKYENPTDDITPTMEINSKLGRLKIAFSVDLIINLIDFVKTLQISQDTARSTASVAVHKVQERGKNVKYIKLNIEIDAPEILMLSASSSVLVIYLGYLVLSNSFSERESVSFQDYEIQLSSVQMYRSCVTSDGILSDDKVYILQPCGIIVVIQKNATPRKCKDIPFVAVSVKFTPVKLHISVCDTETIADVVNYNLKQILSTTKKNGNST